MRLNVCSDWTLRLVCLWTPLFLWGQRCLNVNWIILLLWNKNSPLVELRKDLIISPLILLSLMIFLWFLGNILGHPWPDEIPVKPFLGLSKLQLLSNLASWYFFLWILYPKTLTNLWLKQLERRTFADKLFNNREPAVLYTLTHLTAEHRRKCQFGFKP